MFPRRLPAFRIQSHVASMEDGMVKSALGRMDMSTRGMSV